MAGTATSKGIFDSANREAREHLVELLTRAYWMERVIKAETGAIEHCTRLFEGFLREYELEGRA